jgi:hypothetical protein
MRDAHVQVQAQGGHNNKCSSCGRQRSYNLLRLLRLLRQLELELRTLKTRRLNCQNLCPVLLGWAPGGFPDGVCGFPPPPWVVGALGIRSTCPPSAPGRTSHNSPGHRATRRRVVGACQGCAATPPAPRAVYWHPGRSPSGWFGRGGACGPPAPVAQDL